MMKETVYVEHLWAPVLKVIEEQDGDREQHGDGDHQNHHQARVDHLANLSGDFHKLMVTNPVPIISEKLANKKSLKSGCR